MFMYSPFVLVGLSIVPVYIVAAFFPYLRGRMAYFLPCWVVFLAPITIAIPFTLKYTLKSVNAVGGAAGLQQNQQNQLNAAAVAAAGGPTSAPQLGFSTSGGANGPRPSPHSGGKDGGWMGRSTPSPKSTPPVGSGGATTTGNVTSSAPLGTHLEPNTAQPSGRVPNGQGMAVVNRLPTGSSHAQLTSPTPGGSGSVGVGGNSSSSVGGDASPALGSEASQGATMMTNLGSLTLTPNSGMRRLQSGNVAAMMPGSMATVGEEDHLTSITSPPQTAHKITHHPDSREFDTPHGNGHSGGTIGTHDTHPTLRNNSGSSDLNQNGTTHHGTIVIVDNGTKTRGQGSGIDDDEFIGTPNDALPMVSVSTNMRTLSPHAVAAALASSGSSASNHGSAHQQGSPNQGLSHRAISTPGGAGRTLEPLNSNRDQRVDTPLSSSANGHHHNLLSHNHQLSVRPPMKLALPDSMCVSPTPSLQSISHTARSTDAQLPSDRSLQAISPAPLSAHSTHPPSAGSGILTSAAAAVSSSSSSSGFPSSTGTPSSVAITTGTGTGTPRGSLPPIIAHAHTSFGIFNRARGSSPSLLTDDHHTPPTITTTVPPIINSTTSGTTSSAVGIAISPTGTVAILSPNMATATTNVMEPNLNVAAAAASPSNNTMSQISDGQGNGNGPTVRTAYNHLRSNSSVAMMITPTVTPLAGGNEHLLRHEDSSDMTPRNDSVAGQLTHSTTRV
jgi:hypothetical protein